MLRALIITPSSIGYLFPCLRLANELSTLGVESTFCTGMEVAPIVRAAGFQRVDYETPVNPFAIESWHVPQTVAWQAQVLKLALVELCPDIIIASQMCVSYTLLGDLTRDKLLLVLGGIVPLWPRTSESEKSDATARQRRERQRFADWARVAENAADLVGCNPADRMDYRAWYGDSFLLRGTPAIDPLSHDPHLRFDHLGDLLYEPPQSTTVWRDFAEACRNGIVYVQHGRHFGKSELWNYVNALFESDEKVILADMLRFDGALERAPPNIFYRSQIPLLEIQHMLSAIVCSGGATASLVALRFRKPLIIGVVGSGGEDLAEILTDQKLAFAFDPQASVSDALLLETNRFLEEGSDDSRAKAISTSLEKASASKVLRGLMGGCR